mmetsp:Transcript_4335/g.6170  ORF Transcript_4335/g.6170 Transcript_4335/m.6170 type:complete len:128 (-) Transcript_4335:121-504(-)
MSILDVVEAHLQRLLERISGLVAVQLSDRDGITLAKTAESKVNVSKLSLVFSNASDQASKLGLGANSTITTFYGGYIIVQATQAPLVITFIGTEELNVGLVKKCLPSLRNSLENVREKVDSVIAATS